MNAYGGLVAVLLLCGSCTETEAKELDLELVRCGGDPKPALFTGSTVEQARGFEVYRIQENRVRAVCDALGVSWLPMPFTGIKGGGIRLFEGRFLHTPANRSEPTWEFRFFVVGDPEIRRRLDAER